MVDVQTMNRSKSRANDGVTSGESRQSSCDRRADTKFQSNPTHSRKQLTRTEAQSGEQAPQGPAFIFIGRESCGTVKKDVGSEQMVNGYGAKTTATPTSYVTTNRDRAHKTTTTLPPTHGYYCSATTTRPGERCIMPLRNSSAPMIDEPLAATTYCCYQYRCCKEVPLQTLPPPWPLLLLPPPLLRSRLLHSYQYCHYNRYCQTYPCYSYQPLCFHYLLLLLLLLLTVVVAVVVVDCCFSSLLQILPPSPLPHLLPPLLLD